MAATDDLASLFAQEPSAAMRYGQGQILSWNADTFENVILWNGQALENLPVVGTTDALSYQPGQYVALHGMDASGERAATQWWIAGRILIPGVDNAEAVVDFMRATLARQIAAEVFASRIVSDFDTAIAARNSVDFGDPTNGADPGPTVTIDIQTGSALVILSANMRLSTEDTLAANAPEYASLIGFAVSGATTIAADESHAINAVMWKYNNAGMTNTDGVVMALGNTYVYPVTGLNTGLNTFTMKYATWSTATTGLQVDDRSLTVIGF